MKPQLQLPRICTWHRVLPEPGRVLVAPGQSVQPDTSVAETDVPVAPIIIALDGARPLVQTGQTLHAGVVVAERKKLLAHGDELRSPVAATVLKVSTTELLLQPPPLSTTLLAQLPGNIAAVRSNTGVEVEGCYAILRGRAFASADIYGRLGEEIAVVVEPLTISQLHALAGQGMRAIIAPGWADDPEPSWIEDQPAVFLTEPRPGRPMATPIAQALQTHIGRPAALATGWSPLLAIAAESAVESQCFGPGSWVRLADGRTGQLTSVEQQARFFPSGVRAIAAQVDVGDSTETVALDSLEWVA